LPARPRKELKINQNLFVALMINTFAAGTHARKHFLHMGVQINSLSFGSELVV
jgi:hypothetical protein